MQQQTIVVTQPRPFQVVTANPQPGPNVVIQTAPVSQQPPNYAKQQSMVLGILQIISGFVAIVVNIVLLVLSADDYYTVASDVGYGIWCGVFFLVSGSLGIAASKNTTYGVIVGHMTMCIFSSIFAGILIIAASVGAANQCGDHSNYYYSWYSHCVNHANLGLNLVLVIVAIFEGVLSIWGSAISCSATCCRTNYRAGNVIAPNGTIQYTTATVSTTGYNPQAQHFAYPYPGQAQPAQFAYPQPTYIQSTAAGPSNPPPPPAYAANPDEVARKA